MGSEKFTFDDIKNLANDMSKNNLVSYDDLPRYDLFLSQVIDYLNDKFSQEKYTNNIVQNYIKSEVISKPEDGKKRGYTKLHLVQLVLLSYMRPVLTTDEINKVFRLAFNEINDRNDDIVSWEEVYKIFEDIQKHSFDEFLNADYYDKEAIEDFAKKNNLSGEEFKRVSIFLTVMTLVAQASAIKKLAQQLIEKYGI
ncbi:DUF1836 domain-containing protein [Clostridium sp. 19966]|uniref:DUF1836 domain-containing protein n=1 Tax=Clostridium sp. 19966 TaxID=2768166 RepID=UPI0028DFE75B|nr:DUF1836 domain-containing protein [Clostridium sp. 19966]MDT8717297.1 DUF1836 domain-containing protein [Clostridium sp. 19966]